MDGVESLRRRLAQNWSTVGGSGEQPSEPNMAAELDEGSELEKLSRQLTAQLSYNNELLAQVQASAATSITGDNELVREQLNALLSRARLDVAVADAQAAYGGVLTAMGRDPYPQGSDMSLAELAAAFRRGPVGPS